MGIMANHEGNVDHIIDKYELTVVDTFMLIDEWCRIAVRERIECGAVPIQFQQLHLWSTSNNNDIGLHVAISGNK